MAPQTQALYDNALTLFSALLESENTKLPDDEQEMPPLLEEFGEVLWQDGETKAALANLLSALELTEALELTGSEMR